MTIDEQWDELKKHVGKVNRSTLPNHFGIIGQNVVAESLLLSEIRRTKTVRYGREEDEIRISWQHSTRGTNHNSVRNLATGEFQRIASPDGKPLYESTDFPEWILALPWIA